MITTNFTEAYEALANYKGKLFEHKRTKNVTVVAENLGRVSDNTDATDGTRIPVPDQTIRDLTFSKPSIYIVAETPRKAREELIEHLGITLEEISLTDANLKFLDLQRSRKDSHATAT